jgi:hypothetical protein
MIDGGATSPALPCHSAVIGRREVGPARLRQIIQVSKSATADSDWRYSTHRPWLLDCPVKPGNDTDRVSLIGKGSISVIASQR